VTAPLLEITGLSKGFPGVKALDSVDLKVQTGEIHALMGENGAGKSTLIKVLTGVFPRDAGETRLDGQIIAPKSPREAEALGISTVYQEVNLIRHLSVAENICLGRQPTWLGAIRWVQSPSGPELHSRGSSFPLTSTSSSPRIQLPSNRW